jgi:DNA-binding transcriptional LysR family regulator
MGRADDLDWDDLRYFLRAAQARTLAGAARAMGVEHTTIGRRLSALERSLGAPLVLRGPEGLQLTPLGEKLAPLVEEVERAVAAVRELASSGGTRVRLAVPSGWTGLFAPRLSQLHRDHPALALELVSGSRPVDIRKGEADLAIRSGPIADKELVVRRLGESGWSLYASAAYLARHPRPSDPDDLAGHEIIGYDASLSAMPAAQWIKARAGASIVLRSREMTDMLAAAVSGVGLAVLPCMLGDMEPALERLTDRVVATRGLSLVYRREARMSASVRAVVSFVMDTIRGQGALISGVRRDR